MLKTRSADLLLVLATLLAGIGWIFSKETIHEMPPFAFIGLRFTVSAFILLPICFKNMIKVPKTQLSIGAFIGILQGTSLSLWIYAVSITTELGSGAFIMSLSMLFVPLCSWLIFRNKPSTAFWFSLPIAALGLLLLSINGGGWSLQGSQLIFLCSALILSFQFLTNSHVSKWIPTAVLTCIQFFFTGMFALFLSKITEIWPDQISVSTWCWFFASVLPATCARFFIQITGQKNTTSANAALIMILEPVWTVVFSVLWYEEQTSASKIMGCSLILSSLLLYRGWSKIASIISNRKTITS
ncbi:DMT family transporter [Vibrio salinus]|uniref:DMT family transporter n=1 Tax=Vibrio salinus TaxID=2899784 RepID=UPI001E573C99|nr:DMT family transporter [Vibrio salinus]MCE0495320.1 DMT family transporter [Vibrio salinus]